MLASIADDVLGFPFLKNAARPRLYGPKRAFVFRNSYTDWHYHVTDETLMCQVKAPKETLLLQECDSPVFTSAYFEAFRPPGRPLSGRVPRTSYFTVESVSLKFESSDR